jgi:hypothetical protein
MMIWMVSARAPRHYRTALRYGRDFRLRVFTTTHQALPRWSAHIRQDKGSRLESGAAIQNEIETLAIWAKVANGE